jgi:hypothetical protein
MQETIWRLTTQKRFNMPQKLKPGMECMQIAVPVPIKRRFFLEAIGKAITHEEAGHKECIDTNKPKELI